LKKTGDISEIMDFLTRYPESSVSRRILREQLGTAPPVLTAEIKGFLRRNLEISDELIIEGYKYLVR